MSREVPDIDITRPYDRLGNHNPSHVSITDPENPTYTIIRIRPGSEGSDNQPAQKDISSNKALNIAQKLTSGYVDNFQHPKA